MWRNLLHAFKNAEDGNTKRKKKARFAFRFFRNYQESHQDWKTSRRSTEPRPDRGTAPGGTLIAVPFGNDSGLLSDHTGVMDEEAKQRGRNFEALIANLPNEVEADGHLAKENHLADQRGRDQRGTVQLPSWPRKTQKSKILMKFANSKSGDVIYALVFLSSRTLSIFLPFRPSDLHSSFDPPWK